HLFWDFLKNKNIIQTELFTSKEVLYNMDISKVSPPSNSLTRLLAEEDYIKWKPLRLADLKEVGLPSDLSEVQMLELFMEKVSRKIIWGLFLEDQLVSIAELNAKTAELGQLGGVYTHPSFRQKGYGRCMIQQLLWDIKHIHRIRKLII
ncbi:MAG: hypothetical protein EB051_04560, partial [Chlamydiia bacterium]|nr:hypothetical protein [Chlamydiia bacterium]